MNETAGCGCQYDADGKAFVDRCVCSDHPGPGKSGQVLVVRDGKRVWEWPAAVSEVSTLIAVQANRIAELEGRIAEFADTWTSLTPDQRTVIRRESEDLYNAMGASATAYYYPGR